MPKEKIPVISLRCDIFVFFKKNELVKRYLSFIIFVCCVTSLAAQGTDVRSGVLQVKLKPGSEQLVRQSFKKQSVGGIIQTGIAKMDVLNSRYHVVKMQPVFNIGGPFEERQRHYGLHLWYEISIDSTANPQEVAAEYLQSGAVETASPVYKIKRAVGEIIPYNATSNLQQQSLTPDDPRFPVQWNFNNTGQPASRAVAGVDIRMPEAWNITAGNPNVIVAVMDGGIDYTHPDLSGNMWPGKGYNFVNNTANITFDDHGTHVAGIVAARSNNGIGVSGVAGGWGDGRGVQLMSCEIFSGNTAAENADVARAFQFAADNGAVIAQNSWNYDTPGVYNAAIEAGIHYFIDNAGKDNAGNPLPGTPMAGGLVIFVSGNEHSSRNDYYPGMDPAVFCVAAVGPTGKRAWYSNYSEAVDISAPGGDKDISDPEGGILSTISVASGSYGWDQGTSMACPHVSGVAALVLSRFGSESYTPEMLRTRLLQSANPLNNAPEYAAGKMGAGLMDASKALTATIPVTGITIAPASVKLVENDTTSLTGSILPADATNQNKTWKSSDAEIVSVDNKGNIKARKTGEAKITATTEDGYFSASSTIAVYRSAHIPQGFSPNGDGINDTFEMILDSRETYALKVFDKSGQFYFQTDDYKNNWDGVANTGVHKSRKVLPGTYFYQLKAQQSGHVQTGYVVIK